MTTPTHLHTQLQTAVIADLLGPANGPEEIVDEGTVRDRYLVGKLGPKGQSPLPEADDPLTVDDVEGELDVAGVDTEDGVTEARPPRVASMQPSSLGLSFVAAGEATHLQISARWGRYVLIHSFAHALMRQFALQSGYTSASVRERIYSRNPGDDPDRPEPMAGVLVYTAAPDSEGALGGLVSLGEPEELSRYLNAALGDAQLCASDPLCAEHPPSSDGITLHAAACHACMFAPETSCERGNRYLDRSVIVPTLARDSLAYFPAFD